MDRVAIIVLQREVEADCAVAEAAFRLAQERAEGGAARDIEAAAFQLLRCYNVLEQAGLRVAKAFENQIDDEGGWRAEIMRRLSLDIPGIRPALWMAKDLPHLRDLRGFRHVVVHAYDVSLAAARLNDVLRHGNAVFDVASERSSPLCSKGS